MEPHNSDTKETSANFYRFFTTEAAALQQQIARLRDTSVTGGERADAIDRCLAGIARLSGEVKDAAAYLPGYDQRTYSEQIKSLSAHLTTTRTSVAPKPKFSFKSSSGFRKQASAPPITNGDILAPNSSSASETISTSAPSPAHRLSPYAEDKASRRRLHEGQMVPTEGPWGHGDGAVDVLAALKSTERKTREEKVEYQDLAWALHPVLMIPGQPFNISYLRNAHIVLRSPEASNASASNSTTATLSHLSHTLVDLFGSSASQPQPPPHTYTSLTFNNIHNSIVITGSIAGPIHITDVTNSILLVSQTRQFRMHHSKDVDVYLNVASRPVMEDCSGIRFAPLPEEFLFGDWHRKGEDRVEGKEGGNLWDQVQDFNWLRAEQSPHWDIMPVEERDGMNWKRLREDEADMQGVREIVGKLGHKTETIR